MKANISINTAYIVEDDDSNRHLIEHMLKNQSWQVQSFSGGQEFLRYYRAVNDPMHNLGCLITDYMMPGMNGLELHQEILRQGWLLPVIVVTASREISVALRAMKSGVYDFIEKPIEMANLIDSVSQALSKQAENIEKYDEKQTLSQLVEELTERELTVFLHHIRGLSAKEIALQLGISHRTVEKHRLACYRKLKVSGIHDCIRVALISGLIQEPQELKNTDKQAS